MKIPSPQQLGLPEKFQDWRSNQEDAIEKCLMGSKRETVISAPTGFGKTGVVLGVASMAWKVFKESTCIVTATKGLQDQYLEDGESLGVADLRGRDNYICEMRRDVNFTCSQGYNARCTYKGTPMCPASQAEMRAAISPIVLTNYDKWTSSKKYGQGLNHISRVIFDEGHHMPEALARAMQLTFHSKEIEQDLKINFPGGSELEDMREWKQWASAARTIAEQEMVTARGRLIHNSNPKASWVKHYTHMKHLVRRLGVLATAAANDWIVEQIEDGFQFDPIRPGRYVESALLLKVPKVAVLSATVRPKTMFMSGIGREQFDFFEYPSTFDPNRCPIYWVPTMKVEYGRNLGPLWTRVDQVLSARQKVKGIIHTISYPRQEELLDVSRFSDYMIANRKGQSITRKVEEYKAAGPGYRLVSPSVSTGYDFPDDECRFQIVLKTPFEPPSKIQKARQADDKEYVYYRAMQYLVQAFGRDMRSETDWSERFIFDDHFGEWFKNKYSHLAPKSFHAVYKRADILPQPLKF